MCSAVSLFYRQSARKSSTRYLYNLPSSCHNFGSVHYEHCTYVEWHPTERRLSVVERQRIHSLLWRWWAWNILRSAFNLWACWYYNLCFTFSTSDGDFWVLRLQLRRLCAELSKLKRENGRGRIKIGKQKWTDAAVKAEQGIEVSYVNEWLN